jgi:hypothetical protein
MSSFQGEHGGRGPVELLRYLQWGMNALGLTRELDRLRSGALDDFTSEVTGAIAPFLSFALVVNRQVQLDEVLEHPNDYYRFETVEEPIQTQTLGQVRMLGAMVLSILGNYEGYRQLGALLVTENLNRKLAISRFLSIATDGQIGASEPRIPSRSDATNWATRIYHGELEIRSRLQDVAQVYFQ